MKKPKPNGIYLDRYIHIEQLENLPSQVKHSQGLEKWKPNNNYQERAKFTNKSCKLVSLTKINENQA